MPPQQPVRQDSRHPGKKAATFGLQPGPTPACKKHREKGYPPPTVDCPKYPATRQDLLSTASNLQKPRPFEDNLCMRTPNQEDFLPCSRLAIGAGRNGKASENVPCSQERGFKPGVKLIPSVVPPSSAGEVLSVFWRRRLTSPPKPPALVLPLTHAPGGRSWRKRSVQTMPSARGCGRGCGSPHGAAVPGCRVLRSAKSQGMHLGSRGSSLTRGNKTPCPAQLEGQGGCSD